MSVSAPPVTALWYTRCPVPTASSLAIAQGWLDDEFAPDGITVVLAARRAPTAPCASRTSTTRRRRLVPPGRQHPADLDPLARRRRAPDRALVGRAVPGDRRPPRDSGIERPGGPQGPPARARPPRQRPDRLLARRPRCAASTARCATSGSRSTTSSSSTCRWTSSTCRATRPRAAARCSAPTRTARLQSAEVLALIRGEVDAIYVAGGRGPDLEALLDVDVVFDIAGAGRPGAEDQQHHAGGAHRQRRAARGAARARRPLRRARRCARRAGRPTTRSRRAGSSPTRSASPRTSSSRATRARSTRTWSRRSTRTSSPRIESQQAFLLEHGYIESAFDVRAWIDPGAARRREGAGGLMREAPAPAAAPGRARARRVRRRRGRRGQRRRVRLGRHRDDQGRRAAQLRLPQHALGARRPAARA